jgi:predicted RNA-binding protein with TRAM domain
MEEEQTNKKMIPPVKVDDVLEDLEVINSGKKNDGVVKYEGYIIFVNDCTIGDIVTFKMTKVFKNFGLAELLHKEKGDLNE